ncbi:MAG: tetratricopeptide repeat protein [Deltaproteobacteria bacterium]|nr:MAG: tetratricopeptide repeat protein [Deltaproteobacteria bacterium]
MLVLFIAAAIAQQPARDKALLHPHVEQIVAEKEQEQEQTLRRLLSLGGSAEEQAEVTARLAAVLRARGLSLSIRAQAEADQGDEVSAGRDRATVAAVRAEAIARYRELLKKYPAAPRLDEALFFLADILQDSSRDQEAVAAARELVKKYPRSPWAPASHVFLGEHLFDQAKLAEALHEYRAAAEVPGDEVYPYALYKAAWCRFNQGAFVDAMKLLRRVVEVSAKAGDENKVHLAREARRDYVIAYARVGKPEAARDEFAQIFGAEAGRKMLEQYGKLLFETGRDPEAQLVHRQLLEIHGDIAAAALDRTRLLVLAQRSGRRTELLREAKLLTETFLRVKKNAAPGDEAFEEASRIAEETLRNLAVQIHNEARKTDLEETWAAARSLYSQYLTIFPDAPDAYELRFFYGELLYAQDDKGEAAGMYEAVVRQDMARNPPGRWLQKAAWSAVLSRDEFIRGDAKEKKDTGERRAQRPLTADEQKLAAACRLYLLALPEGPHAVEVAFKVGRLEYVSSDLPEAEKHLSWVALKHPEHELAEYAANLVLDISNLRKDWESVHRWAIKFLEDRKLTAHGTLANDLRRIEEESAYGISDSTGTDEKKAETLLAFAASHPKGELTDKALFGAAAALSRAGRVDDALAARARVWKETPASPLVPRALLSSASDHAAVGDVGEAAALLEKYAAGFQKQHALEKWLREHGKTRKAKSAPVYEETKAQTALHDAAFLREARGELRQALSDRALALQLWKKAADSDDELFAKAALRARLGEAARAAREFTAVAREAKAKPALELTALREAARQYARAGETGNAQWSWTELERVFKSLAPKAREKLTPDALAAAAEAHFALGTHAFDQFKRQQIQPPLMATLNRKVTLLQAVKRRAEETVAMRQAEPAVCALAQLGEAQILLGQAIAQSPFPPRLNGEQRKLYREMLEEKAQPLQVDARETLKSADEKARELGVTGSCAAKVSSLLEKVNAKPGARPQMQLAPAPLAPASEFLEADAKLVAAGEPQPGERARRLLDDALVALKSADKIKPEELVAKFQAAAEESGAPGIALFDYAVALDRAGRAEEAESVYRKIAKGELGYRAAERLVSLALSRGDVRAARQALSIADSALAGDARAKTLRAELELMLGDAPAARSALRLSLAQRPNDVRALCALARAHLAQGDRGAARLFAARAAQVDPHHALPLIVKAEVARAENDPAAELAAARAAAEVDERSALAALVLGRALFERGLTGDAVDQFARAAALDAGSYPAALALGQALAASGRTQEAEQALARAVALAPKAAQPHLDLARLKLDGDNDAQAALSEAKLFLALSTQPPPPGHPIHALVQRCEEALKQRAQASVVQQGK